MLALGIWAYIKLESSMNIVAEKQLLIEPSGFSYKMWKDMPVTMYQSFTFFNLTNWNQVKSIGQKPRFVEVGPYVYRTIWTKSDINFLNEEKLVTFAEKKQWIFQAHLSKGSEDDQIWTINTPLMTALALIQNAPVITRNIVSVILDGLGEGAFIKRNIRSLLFDGYSDLIVSVGPLFDRRFANFNGKFAYLYNKNDSTDGVWTVSTGTDDLSNLNKITRFQSSIVNMTSFSTGQLPHGLNEVKPECAPAWSLDQSTNGQLFSPFNKDLEQLKLNEQISQFNQARTRQPELVSSSTQHPPVGGKRFFSRSTHQPADTRRDQHQPDLIPYSLLNQKLGIDPNVYHERSSQEKIQPRDIGKFIFYPDLCRPIHLLPSKQEVSTPNGIKASRYYIDPKVFMNSTQVPTNRCYEMNPRPALANALAATINSVTGANVAMPNLVTGASSPFAMFIPPTNHHGDNNGGLFERSNHQHSFLNNALHGFGASNQDQQPSSSNNPPMSRLSRVRQLFSNIVSQRMSAASPASILPSLTNGPAAMLMGNHFPSTARNSPDDVVALASGNLARPNSLPPHGDIRNLNLEALQQNANQLPVQTPPAGGSDRWITQFRFKWPKGVFSIGQCQLGAPIYASLPHFLDADEYYLEQVDGLKPNRSLHEFYIDVESNLRSIPVGAKARLQLNVATPELRFRNIPNAMIPVLWQEVTFDIDKPIATMLYWSFTMSPSIYKLISLILLAIGSITLVLSLVRSVKNYRDKRSNKLADIDHHHQQQQHRVNNTRLNRSLTHNEGQVSSWQSHMIRNDGEVRGCVNSNVSNDALDEIRHGAALNHGFSSCTEFHDRLSDNGRQATHTNRLPSSSSNTTANGSPKQPSSRASSQCELVSSLGTTVNCAGCLLACLRHSQNNSNLHDHLPTSAGDSSLVRQQQLQSQQQHQQQQLQQVTTSDIDKATLSSRGSDEDSCSSTYTQRIRTFK